MSGARWPESGAFSWFAVDYAGLVKRMLRRGWVLLALPLLILSGITIPPRRNERQRGPFDRTLCKRRKRVEKGSLSVQSVYRFPDGSMRLRSGNAIDQCSFCAEALAGLVEPRFLAGRESSAVTVCYHVPNTGGQRGGFAELTTCPQLSRPFPGIPGQFLSRRAQANRDGVNTIGEQAQSDTFGAIYWDKQRSPAHELDVVVVVGRVRHIIAGHDILDRVERITTRQATNGAKTMARMEDQIAWTKHSSKPPVVPVSLPWEVEQVM
jgi:hypothetical protein